MSKSELEQVNVMRMAVWVEGGLFGLALLAGWLGFYHRDQPLNQIDVGEWKVAINWGLLGMIPMLVYLFVSIFWPPKFLQPMNEFVRAQLRPMFSRQSTLNILIISAMAGFCEEIAFRWCLQGGLDTVLGLGPWIALAIASFIFGLCHWVNAAYGVTTTIVGAFLGWMMIYTETWLAPAITHFLFDYVAIFYIANWMKASKP